MHCLSEGLDFFSVVADTKRNVVWWCLLAPFFEEFVNRFLHFNTAIWISYIQYISGNKLTDRVNQLESFSSLKLA